ncbi:nucleoside-diphosphate-sugar epimerase [Sagittula marina]|uniref:Nucleoside-diphosphate-sugar epimerase n=1 Tax=Sagittula marina TaxID=943940 RepID=A0A7W6GPV0_9RHOB|nr:NAD-dependent epimerase/dehydratase family protein [Sagittula marina]MBB3983731.1 nucleoside-diphosphate-sugar epimerase [Sagittula marina]
MHFIGFLHQTREAISVSRVCLKECKVLLGASGKVGRMVRTLMQGDGSGLICLGRSGAPGVMKWTDIETQNFQGVQAVLAFWGVTSGNDRQLSGNAELAIKAQELAVILGAELVVHCSSVAVYGAQAEVLTEDSCLRPANAYGQAKSDMEKALADWQASHPDGPRTIVLRLANIAGADSLFGNLVPGGTVRLHRFPDGRGPCRSYISPVDLVTVLGRLSSSAEISGTFNLGAPVATDMADIVRAAGAKIEWERAPRDAIQEVAVDMTQLVSHLPGLSLAHDATTLVSDVHAAGGWSGNSL